MQGVYDSWGDIERASVFSREGFFRDNIPKTIIVSVMMMMMMLMTESVAAVQALRAIVDGVLRVVSPDEAFVLQVWRVGKPATATTCEQ